MYGDKVLELRVLLLHSGESSESFWKVFNEVDVIVQESGTDFFEEEAPHFSRGDPLGSHLVCLVVLWKTLRPQMGQNGLCSLLYSFNIPENYRHRVVRNDS